MKPPIDVRLFLPQNRRGFNEEIYALYPLKTPHDPDMHTFGCRGAKLCDATLRSDRVDVDAIFYHDNFFPSELTRQSHSKLAADRDESLLQGLAAPSIDPDDDAAPNGLPTRRNLMLNASMYRPNRGNVVAKAVREGPENVLLLSMSVYQIWS